MRYVLVGNRNKRLDFFKQACERQQIDLHVIDMEELLCCETKEQIASYFLPGDIVKIDPVSNFGFSIEAFHQKIRRYQRALEFLCECFEPVQNPDLKLQNDLLCSIEAFSSTHIKGLQHNIVFLNTPNSILQTLNKRSCKQILKGMGLPITPMLDFGARDFEELLFYMREKRAFQIFIKPLTASGAGGIITLKYQPKTERLLAQSAMFKQGDIFVNTKKVRTFKNRDEIKQMIDFILKEDCVFERWMPKDRVKNTLYDLRVLYQFDEICFIQARGAKDSAITNLLLNNMPVDLEQVALSEETLYEMKEICKQAIKGFDGLRVAGFDFLIELHSKKPYIIEINAQGDLIYSDIHKDNTIYKAQVQWMKSRAKELIKYFKPPHHNIERH